MKRKLVWGAAIGAAYGAACGWVLAAMDASLAVTAAVAVLPIPLVVLYCRRALRRAPQRYRAIVQRHFDPEAGPPAGSEPVDEPLVRRWFAGADDWRALEELLAPDFRFHAVSHRRRLNRAMFVRGLRTGSKWMGECKDELLEAVVDPSDPDVLWIKQHSVIQPPDGREIRSAQWARWTLTPGHEQIRAIEVVAFTAPPVLV